MSKSKPVENGEYQFFFAVSFVIDSPSSSSLWTGVGSSEYRFNGCCTDLTLSLMDDAQENVGEGKKWVVVAGSVCTFDSFFFCWFFFALETLIQWPISMSCFSSADLFTMVVVAGGVEGEDAIWMDRGLCLGSLIADVTFLIFRLLDDLFLSGFVCSINCSELLESRISFCLTAFLFFYKIKVNCIKIFSSFR